MIETTPHLQPETPGTKYGDVTQKMQQQATETAAFVAKITDSDNDTSTRDRALRMAKRESRTNNLINPDALLRVDGMLDEAHEENRLRDVINSGGRIALSKSVLRNSFENSELLEIDDPRAEVFFDADTFTSYGIKDGKAMRVTMGVDSESEIKHLIPENGEFAHIFKPENQDRATELINSLLAKVELRSDEHEAKLRVKQAHEDMHQLLHSEPETMPKSPYYEYVFQSNIERVEAGEATPLPEGYSYATIDTLTDSEIEKLNTTAFSGIEGEAPWVNRSKTLSSVGLRESDIFIVDKDGHLVGMGVTIFREEQGEMGELAVHPDHRHKGLAKAMVLERIAEAKRLGVDSLYMPYLTSENSLKSFYLEHGFTENPDGSISRGPNPVRLSETPV